MVAKRLDSRFPKLAAHRCERKENKERNLLIGTVKKRKKYVACYISFKEVRIRSAVEAQGQIMWARSRPKGVWVVQRFDWAPRAETSL